MSSAEPMPERMAETPLLNAEKIFKAADMPDMVRVEVPEWGGHLFVKVMTGAERDRWELAFADGMKARAQANVRGMLVAMCACGPDGKRLFTDNQAAQLGSKSAVALDRIFDKAKHLNKILDADIEELEKNS